MKILDRLLIGMGNSSFNKLEVVCDNSSVIGVVVRAAVGQSSDLFQISNSLGQLLLKINGNGNLNLYNSYTDLNNYSSLLIDTTGSTLTFNIQEAGLNIGNMTGFTFNKSITLSGNAGIVAPNGAVVVALLRTSQFLLDGAMIDLDSPGNLLLWNNTNTTFGSIKLGGTSSSFPAIKRTNSDIEITKADGTQVDTALILSSPSGNRFRITVSDVGVVTTTPL